MSEKGVGRGRTGQGGTVGEAVPRPCCVWDYQTRHLSFRSDEMTAKAGQSTHCYNKTLENEGALLFSFRKSVT